MIIDSHAHLKHGNADRTEYRPEQIVESLDQAGVDKSVVFGICTKTPRTIELAREAHEAYPDRLIPYAYALPDPERAIIPDLEEALRDYGFKGIKLHCGECTVTDYVADPVLRLAGKYGVPCLIDFLGRHAELERIATDFPDTTVIAAHLGQFLGTNQDLIDKFVGIAESHPNVYLDISGVVLLWKIREAVDRVGPERVLWGSDGPYPKPDLATYITTDIAKVRASGISPKDQEAVLGGSIARLLGL